MDNYALYILIWEVFVFIIIFSLMFNAMQSIDFSKFFKANSSKQINIIIIMISAGIAFGIAIGLGNILSLITEI